MVEINNGWAGTETEGKNKQCNIPEEILTPDSALTDAVARLNDSDFNNPDNMNKLTGRTEVTFNGITVGIDSSLDVVLGVEPHKLLAITASRIPRTKNKNAYNGGVWIYYPLQDYAKLRGWKYTPKTKEDIKDTLRGACKILRHADFTDNRISGEKGDFHDFNIAGEAEVKGDTIRIFYLPTSAQYFSRLPLMRYPTALLKLKGTTYRTGVYLCEHYSRNKSEKSHNQELLTVLSILKRIDIYRPTNIKKWKNQLKKPLETALNNLVKAGVLESWEYILKKEPVITGKGENVFSKRDEWEQTVIKFNVAMNKVDYPATLTEKAGNE